MDKGTISLSVGPSSSTKGPVATTGPSDLLNGIPSSPSFFVATVRRWDMLLLVSMTIHVPIKQSVKQKWSTEEERVVDDEKIASVTAMHRGSLVARRRRRRRCCYNCFSC